MNQIAHQQLQLSVDIVKMLGDQVVVNLDGVISVNGLVTAVFCVAVSVRRGLIVSVVLLNGILR